MTGTGLGPIDRALLPADVRNGTPEDRKRYEAALGFERMLVSQLTQQLADTAKPGDPLFDRVQPVVVASNELAAEAGVHQAESEGLDAVFEAAGADWRLAGCSMCLGMNPDQLAPGERSASTSNRNFEGRQGRGGRTHLVSPQVAAATAVIGKLAAPADL